MNSMHTELAKLICPECRFEYTHLVDARWHRPGEEVWWWCNAQTVILAGWCESSHDFEVALSFHKGETFIFARVRDADQDAGFAARRPNPNPWRMTKRAPFADPGYYS